MKKIQKISSLIILCAIVFACCANNQPNKRVETPAAADSLRNTDSLREIRTVSERIIESFDGWKLDTSACLANIDGAMRFLIRGTGATDVAVKEMFVRKREPETAGTGGEILSYVVLRKLAVGQTFEAEVLYIPTAGTVIVYDAVLDDLKKNNHTDVILISKQDLKLRMIKYGNGVELTLPTATGKNAGNKRREGDKKTPEGIFSVYAIHDASDWDYDFKDGKGKIKGSYGKYFIRFKEHYHIGIHGTHLPETLGSRATEGCARLRSEDVERIVPMISRSRTLIAVTPAMDDFLAD